MDQLKLSDQIARHLVNNYKRYQCVSNRSQIWYIFEKHRWVKCPDKSFSGEIFEKLIFEYRELFSYISQLSTMDPTNRDNEENYLEQAEYALTIIKLLQSSMFRQEVMALWANLSYDTNFLKKLDENPKLICFNNGVYDLELDIFRAGKPSDYISLCTNYDYVEWDKTSSQSLVLKKFLRQFQPDKPSLRSLLTILSTSLDGQTPDEFIYGLLGGGSNAKSSIMRLMKYTLGDLFQWGSIPQSARKNKIHPLKSWTADNFIDPQWANKKGVRMCVWEDVDNTKISNLDWLMEVFNKTARGYTTDGVPVQYKSQFKPFFTFNCFYLTEMDDGQWRRFKTIPCDSVFVDKPSLSAKKNEYQIDLDLSDKLQAWAPMFMAKLIKYYRKYKLNGIKFSDAIMEATQKCRNFGNSVYDP